MSENNPTKTSAKTEKHEQDAPTPGYLVPKMGDTGYGEPIYYRSLFILDDLEQTTEHEPLTGPINPFDENNLLNEQKLKPAFGVLTVHEQESETLSTRVLANYNRRHTMNILFFEVLQIYKFRTKLTSWDRCLFVPMIPLDFVAKDVIKTHQLGLLSIFSEFGATDMIEDLNRELDLQHEKAPAPAFTDYDAQINELQKAKQIALEYVEACKPVIQRVPARDAVWLNNGPDSYEDVVVDNSKKQ